jgi:CheY-like chemotaxis protein
MTRKIDLLVIDDDDVTGEMVMRALRGAATDFNIIEARDGLEGLEILRGHHGPKVRRPYLILLDLNMPRMNGFEFLEEVRRDPDLSPSVIFILTTSDSDRDLLRAYDEHVAGYMVKSSIGPQFARLSALLGDYARTVRLPA